MGLGWFLHFLYHSIGLCGESDTSARPWRGQKWAESIFYCMSDYSKDLGWFPNSGNGNCPIGILLMEPSPHPYLIFIPMYKHWPQTTGLSINMGVLQSQRVLVSTRLKSNWTNGCPTLMQAFCYRPIHHEKNTFLERTVSLQHVIIWMFLQRLAYSDKKCKYMQHSVGHWVSYSLFQCKWSIHQPIAWQLDKRCPASSLFCSLVAGESSFVIVPRNAKRSL